MLPAARRTRGYPWFGRRTTGAPLLACMAARRRCSPWPGHSGGVERARGIVRASSPRPEPNALKSKRNEAEIGGFRRGGALRRGRGTPSSDCGLADGFHLCRVCAGAYRGEGKDGGGLRAENGSQARPAASGGARPAMAPRRSLLLRLRSRAGKEREQGGDSRPGGRVYDAGVRPPRGRRQVERGGRVRARRGEGSQAARLNGPRGRQVGLAVPAPFLLFFFFFEFLFSNNFPNSF